MNKTYAFQNILTGEDIKALRHTLKLTQADFSELVGVSKKTIERWESGKEEITGPITRVVRLLWENNQIKDKYEVPVQTAPLRLEHRISMPEMIKELEKYGVQAESKSVYNDIALLKEWKEAI